MQHRPYGGNDDLGRAGELLPPSPRDGMGRFLPGYSGNPSGRPVVLAELRAAAAMCSLGSIEVLRRLRDDESVAPTVRAGAADRLLQWAYGGPAGGKQTKQVTAAELSDADLDELCGPDEDAPGPEMFGMGDHTDELAIVSQREDLPGAGNVVCLPRADE